MYLHHSDGRYVVSSLPHEVPYKPEDAKKLATKRFLSTQKQNNKMRR